MDKKLKGKIWITILAVLVVALTFLALNYLVIIPNRAMHARSASAAVYYSSGGQFSQLDSGSLSGSIPSNGTFTLNFAGSFTPGYFSGSTGVESVSYSLNFYASDGTTPASLPVDTYIRLIDFSSGEDETKIYSKTVDSSGVSSLALKNFSYGSLKFREGHELSVGVEEIEEFQVIIDLSKASSNLDGNYSLSLKRTRVTSSGSSVSALGTISLSFVPVTTVLNLSTSYNESYFYTNSNNLFNLNITKVGVLSGASDPTSLNGSVGDYYYNSTAGSLFIKEMSAGSETWSEIDATILTGSTAPAAGTGSNGNYFVNTTDEIVYLKSAGSWNQVSSSGVDTAIKEYGRGLKVWITNNIMPTFTKIIANYDDIKCGNDWSTSKPIAFDTNSNSTIELVINMPTGALNAGSYTLNFALYDEFDTTLASTGVEINLVNTNFNVKLAPYINSGSGYQAGLTYYVGEDPQSIINASTGLAFKIVEDLPGDALIEYIVQYRTVNLEYSNWDASATEIYKSALGTVAAVGTGIDLTQVSGVNRFTSANDEGVYRLVANIYTSSGELASTACTYFIVAHLG